METAESNTSNHRQPPSRLGLWLALAVVALVVSAALNAWQFMDRRDAHQTAEERFGYAAGEVSRGLLAVGAEVNGEEVDWVRVYENLVVAEQSARMGHYGTPELNGPPRHVRRLFHALGSKLMAYIPAAHRMAHGVGDAEDQRRVEHLSGTVARLPTVLHSQHGWDAYRDWLERLMAAMPPSQDVRRAIERLPEDSTIAIDDDTFVVVRYINRGEGLGFFARYFTVDPWLPDAERAFASVIHVPSWSIMNVDQAGNVMDEGVFSPDAEELFDFIRANEELLQRTAALARMGAEREIQILHQ